jgi:hypothetical protein
MVGLGTYHQQYGCFKLEESPKEGSSFKRYGGNIGVFPEAVV